MNEKEYRSYFWKKIKETLQHSFANNFCNQPANILIIVGHMVLLLLFKYAVEYMKANIDETHE